MSTPAGGTTDQTVRELTETHVGGIRTGDYTLLPIVKASPEIVIRSKEAIRKSFFVALLGLIGDTRALFTTGVKKESAVAMRILVALIVTHGEATGFKQLLRTIGTEEIKKLKLDRHLVSSKTDVGAAAMEFLRVVLIVLNCPPGDVLEAPESVARVEEVLGHHITRRSRSAAGGSRRPRSQTQGPPTTTRSQTDNLPSKRKGESPPFNPLYSSGTEPCLMAVQTPDPVSFFAKHYGLGCVPKTPVWSNRTPPPSDAITASVSGYRPSKSGAAVRQLVGSLEPPAVTTTPSTSPPPPATAGGTTTGAATTVLVPPPASRIRHSDPTSLSSPAQGQAPRESSPPENQAEPLSASSSGMNSPQNTVPPPAAAAEDAASSPPPGPPGTIAMGGSKAAAFVMPPLLEDGSEEAQLLLRYLTSDGILQGWGTCRMGELGPSSGKAAAHAAMAVDGRAITPDLPPCKATPRNLTALTGNRILKVAAGSQYSLLLTTSGTVYCCGAGEWGQLGLGDPSDVLTELVDDEVPVRTNPSPIRGFKNADKITQICAGFAFAVAISQKGEIYLWGNNNHGQCSVGTKPTKNTLRIPSPVKVAMKGSRIIDAVCGSFFVVALTDNHVVLSWGLVSLLGLGPESEVLQHIDQQWITTSLSKEKRNVAIHPCKVSALDSRKIVKLAAGQWHVIAIGLEGGVYSWGIGHQGRLGHNGTTSESRPKRILALRDSKAVDASCGSFHTAIVTKDGSVYCCGDNASGQCGLMNGANFLVPTRVPGFGLGPTPATAAGDDAAAATQQQQASTSGSSMNQMAIAVSCGREHTTILTSEGDIFVFGGGVGTGVGLGVRHRVPHPKRIMPSHVHLDLTCGVGHGFSLALQRKVEMVPAGTLHVGECHTAPINLGDGLVGAALGASFTALLDCAGDVYTFGNGDWGQLGLGPMQRVEGRKVSEGVPYVSTPTKVQGFGRLKVSAISAGYAFVYAITEGNQVFFWGNNNHCQGGLGVDSKNVLKVDEPKEVLALTKLEVVAIACGSFFVIALTALGEVHGWGLQDCCGVSELSQEDQAHLTSSATAEKRTVLATPIKIPELSNIIQIATGQWHSVALSEAGEMFSWGVGHQGRLGHGNTTTLHKPTKIQFDIPFTTIDCGSFNSCAISTCGDLYVWGDNESGQCGLQGMKLLLVPTLAASSVRRASCGRQHTVLVNTKGDLLMTGMIQHGGSTLHSDSFQYPAGLFGSGGQLSTPEMFRGKYYGLDVFSGPHHILMVVERERPAATAVTAAHKELMLQAKRLATGEGLGATSPVSGTSGPHSVGQFPASPTARAGTSNNGGQRSGQRTRASTTARGP